jgi:4-amino-4-deoxy-L-arabinose transferase-like glycosyltransferase
MKIEKRFEEKNKYLLIEISVLIFILIIASFLRLWRINKTPIIIGDEMLHATNAVRILKFGVLRYVLSIPFLYNPYHGPIPEYFMLPFIYFLGPTIFSLRIPMAIGGILTVFFTYLFTKKFYDKLTTFLASLILAILPGHVILSRMGMGEWALPPFFMILSIFALWKFYETKSERYFYLFWFLCGLGVLTRLTFLFYMVPLLAFLINLSDKERRFRLKIFFLGMIIFLFTVYPLVIHFGAIVSMFRNFPITGRGEVNLVEFDKNLVYGLTDRFPNYLNGCLGNCWKNLIFYPLFLLSFSFLFFKNLLKSQDASRRKDIFLLVSFSVTILLLSTLTISTFFSEDFNLLAPFIAIIIARTFSHILPSGRHLSTPLFFVGIIVFIMLFLYGSYSSFRMVLFETEKGCHEYLDESVEKMIQLNPSFLVADTIHTAGSLKWYLYAKNNEKNVYLLLENETGEISINLLGKTNGVFIFASLKCMEDTRLKNRKLVEEFLNITRKYEKIPIKNFEIYSEKGELLYTVYSLKNS